MEHHARGLDWMSMPIAERMSFSSFSHSVDDIWAHDIIRPYQIVLLPGYKVPQGLDRGDKDALIYGNEKVIGRPAIVWDGFSVVALFEIIRECLDYTGADPLIAVRDEKTGKRIRDPRDPEIMKLRPQRRPGWGAAADSKPHHRIECLGRHVSGGRGNLEDICRNACSSWRSLYDAVDSYHRVQNFVERGMQGVSAFDNQRRIFDLVKKGEIKLHHACNRGTPAGKDISRAERDAEVELFDTTYYGTKDLARVRLEDFPHGPPESFYRFALRKGLDELEGRRRKAAVNNKPIKSRRAKSDEAAPAPARRRDKDDNPF